MAFKHYNHLNVPDYWERYFTKYPQGMTILESLFEWVSQVDSMVDTQNKLSDNVEQFRKEIDDFVGRFDERLQIEVVNTIKDWQDSGFLEIIIDEALQTQMDVLEEQTNEKLSQLMVNALIPPRSLTALKGDGQTDDTMALNDLLQYVSDNGYKNLYLPPTADGYLINGVINIPSGVHIYGDNTTIMASQMPNIPNGVNTGIFNAKGTFDDVEQFLTASLLQGEQFVSVIDASQFSAGAMLHFEVTSLVPEYTGFNFVTRVRAVNLNNNTLELVHPPQHDFLLSAGVKVRQFNPLENISIDGFYFDIRHSELINVIQTYYVDGLTIKNIRSTGQGGSTLAINATLNGIIDNIDVKNSSNRSPGRGYAVKVHSGSSNLLITNVLGDFVRHNVDIAGASKNINVENCTGINTSSSCYGLHGMRENNIIFNNCRAFNCSSGLTVGNSSYYRSADVTAIDCMAYNCTNGFNIAEADNVKLVRCITYNCEVNSFQVIYGDNISVDNCEIHKGAGFTIQRSINVQVNNFKTFSVTGRAGIDIYYNVENIYINNYENDGSGTYGIKVGEVQIDEGTIDRYCRNIFINNSTIRNTSGYAVAILYTTEKVFVIGNEILGNTLFQWGSFNGAFRNNYVVGEHVQINPQENFIYTDNFGKFSEHNILGVDGVDGFYNSRNMQYVELGGD